MSADAPPALPNLAAALRAYQLAFGHKVPTDIVDKYASRSGPLVLEIRQALELRKPVPAWLARSKLSAQTINDSSVGPDLDRSDKPQ